MYTYAKYIELLNAFYHICESFGNILTDFDHGFLHDDDMALCVDFYIRIQELYMFGHEVSVIYTRESLMNYRKSMVLYILKQRINSIILIVKEEIKNDKLHRTSIEIDQGIWFFYKKWKTLSVENLTK